MTQHDLADAAGVDLKTVYNLESGTRWPIAKTRVAVSAALQWEGDALAAIADRILPAEVGNDPPDLLPATDAMELAMRAHLEEVQMRVEFARRRHPGKPLTGQMIFPTSPRDAGNWDYLRASGETEQAVVQALAALAAWRAEKARESGNGTVTKFVRRA